MIVRGFLLIEHCYILQLLREIEVLRETVREREAEILRLQFENKRSPSVHFPDTQYRTPKVDVESKGIQNDGPLSSNCLLICNPLLNRARVALKYSNCLLLQI